MAQNPDRVVEAELEVGSLTIGSVNQGAAGAAPWKVDDDESQVLLAAIGVSLAIMDDWDETDRAKVNPIAGQAGVQGASGAVTALTQRVVLATDVALPAGTNEIGKVAAGVANIGIVRTIPTSGRIVDSDDGTTVITVKTAAGTATASGDNTVVAAIAGKKIRVLSYGLQCQETGTVTTIWQDSGTATQRGMKWMLTMGTSQNDGVVRNPGDGSHFYFETAAGAGLDINLSSALDTAWEITYAEVD